MLYFIEGAKAVSSGLLEKHGLAKIIVQPMSRECMNGPGGTAGVVVMDQSCVSSDRMPKYHRESQRWEKRFGFDGTWIGCWDNWQPTPEHLARSKQVPGKEIKLDDGNQWIVPLIRTWMDDIEANQVLPSCCLARSYRRSHETGNLVPGEVVAEFRDLWLAACDMSNVMLEQLFGGNTRIEVDQADKFVERVLSTNYRVSLEEIGFLGLLNDNSYGEVIRMALDWSTLMERLKNWESRQTGGTPQTQVDTDSTSGKRQPIAELNTATIQQLGS